MSSQTPFRGLNGMGNIIKRTEHKQEERVEEEEEEEKGEKEVQRE